MKIVSTVKARVMVFKAVVQMVLIYRGESWIVTDVMLKVIEGLHDILSWRISWMSDRRIGEGG